MLVKYLKNNLLRILCKTFTCIVWRFQHYPLSLLDEEKSLSHSRDKSLSRRRGYRLCAERIPYHSGETNDWVKKLCINDIKKLEK